eukprot:IDg22775t1
MYGSLPQLTLPLRRIAEELIRWFAAFGVVEQWVSDRGTHFKNQLIRLLRESLKSEHHFTLAYCPWSNGTVEVVCRELLRATRALLSEFQLPQKCWPSVLPLVQSALNNSVLERLGNRCPLTAFTGLPQDSPLTTITCRRGKVIETHSIAEVRARQRINIDVIYEALDDMHKDISELSSKKQKSSVDSHNPRCKSVRSTSQIVISCFAAFCNESADASRHCVVRVLFESWSASRTTYYLSRIYLTAIRRSSRQKIKIFGTRTSTFQKIYVTTSRTSKTSCLLSAILMTLERTRAKYNFASSGGVS